MPSEPTELVRIAELDDAPATPDLDAYFCAIDNLADCETRRISLSLLAAALACPHIACNPSDVTFDCPIIVPGISPPEGDTLFIAGFDGSAISIQAGFQSGGPGNPAILQGGGGDTGFAGGNVEIAGGDDDGTGSPTGEVHIGGNRVVLQRAGVPSLPPVYPDNATAVAAGEVAGTIYRTGADPDTLCVVH